jgi:hypothetical protein
LIVVITYTDKDVGRQGDRKGGRRSDSVSEEKCFERERQSERKRERERERQRMRERDTHGQAQYSVETPSLKPKKCRTHLACNIALFHMLTHTSLLEDYAPFSHASPYILQKKNPNTLHSLAADVGGVFTRIRRSLL